MPDAPTWRKLGLVADLQKQQLQQIEIEGKRIALSYADGQFGAVSGTCLHYGGPLGKGTLKEGYIVCPWHHWMFHRVTGEAHPGIPAQVPRYELKIEDGELCINLNPVTQVKHAPHPVHPLSRKIERADGPLRVVGISTTGMDEKYPRYSTSEALLQIALDHAALRQGAQTKLIRLNALKFRTCEGYYSKSATACTWPCSITQMDPLDELEVVYEALVFWADVVLVSTPIRWGSASSLYYKMVERLNCIENQLLVANRSLIQNKVAAFIITGGQDNVQAIAGQMLMFFGELGFIFPKFPFVAHTRGWSAEDMENNVSYVQKSETLKRDVENLVDRATDVGRIFVRDSEVA